MNNRKAKMLISRVYRRCYPSQWLRVSNRRMVLYLYSGIAREGIKDKPFTGNKQVECDYMLSALRRMELRGHLNEIYDGVIVNKKEGNAA